MQSGGERTLALLFRKLALMEDLFDHIRNGDLQAVKKRLQEKPALKAKRDRRGSTPLILAAYYNQAEIVEFLLQGGVEVDEKDASGNTALMGVCFKGYQEVARKLIEAGADVNTRNAMGGTCLIFAITFNREDIAKLLIKHGADINAKDARGQTALDHARMQGLHSLINLLENQ